MKSKADRVVEAELARAMQALARRFVEGDDVSARRSWALLV